MWKKDYHEYFSDISHTKATTLCKKKQPSNIGKIYNFLHAIQNAENRKKYNSKWWYIIELATYRIEENTLALIVPKNANTLFILPNSNYSKPNILKIEFQFLHIIFLFL